MKNDGSGSDVILFQLGGGKEKPHRNTRPREARDVEVRLSFYLSSM
jgi:hypothetical protein